MHECEKPMSQLPSASETRTFALSQWAGGEALHLCLQELELLRTLNFDSRIVQLYGACILEGCPVLVLEFMAVCCWFLTAMKAIMCQQS